MLPYTIIYHYQEKADQKLCFKFFDLVKAIQKWKTMDDKIENRSERKLLRGPYSYKGRFYSADGLISEIRTESQSRF